MTHYWLIKSEPTDYSIDDLQQDETAIWDGVRNYQARNFLRQMQPTDLAFFYHSNVKPPAIVGLARVLESNVNDPTQFDPNSKYYDPKATPDNPRWQTVNFAFVEKFETPISLTQLKERFNPEDLQVVKRGNRLSVMPVNTNIAQQILEMAKQP
ncbi:EVE domain-containing protein [Baaleninema simplex]|uniref:EVE domain-containing protein n=1 Tax=Baaleninema simplex TaxID=2862350 RepID=UPI0003467B22|nr:EVE domain-containing protein [Baaleninema simplex]